MKIILKPGGMAVLLAALGALTLAASRQQAAIRRMQNPPSPSPTPIKNLALNPEMTRTGGDGLPAGWDNVWTGSGAFRATRDTTMFRSAPASLRADTGNGPAKGQVTLMIAAEAGRGYRIRGSVKARGKGTFSLAVQYFDAGYTPVGFEHLLIATPESDWQSCDQTITIPTGATRLGVVLYAQGTGKIWLDDVSLVPSR